MADAFGRYSTQIGSARVAIVVNNDVNYGMARMTQMLAEAQTPTITIRAFRKFEDAERWLDQGIEILGTLNRRTGLDELQ